MTKHNAEQFLLPVTAASPSIHRVVIEFESLGDAQKFYSCADASIRMGHGSLRSAALVVTISKCKHIYLAK